jgi:hypothetical protein
LKNIAQKDDLDSGKKQIELVQDGKKIQKFRANQPGLDTRRVPLTPSVNSQQ